MNIHLEFILSHVQICNISIIHAPLLLSHQVGQVITWPTSGS